MHLKNFIFSIYIVINVICGSYADSTLIRGDVEFAIGGDLDFQVAIRKQDNDFVTKITPNTGNIAIDTSGSLHGSVKCTSIKDWIIGVQIGIKPNIQSKDAAGKDYLDRTYLYAENDEIGRFEAGSNHGASNNMKITGAYIAAATGGVNGSYLKYISVDRFALADRSDASKFVFGNNFIISPKLVAKEGSFEKGSHERYRKLTYYSPEYKGFQVGISYGPDGENRGVKPILPFFISYRKTPLPFPLEEDKIANKLKNAVTGGITWEKSINSNFLKLSIVGEYAKRILSPDESDKNFYPITAFMAGGMYKYGNTSFALSYASHFKSEFEKIKDIKNSYLYSAGIAYDLGRANTSITYLYSNKNSNIFQSIAVGVDYKLTTGIMPFVDIAYFNAKQRRHYKEVNAGPSSIEFTKSTNNGLIYILGTRIFF